MKRIQLVNIQLVNFKGVKNLSVDCVHNTDIFGKNESGKTTVADAWTWNLFGKDSQDRKDFEIQPLDENNQVIEKLDSEVIATMVVDGETIILRKVFSQKWQKKKGSIKPEFTGNMTEHYWNGVPLATAREYQEKVNAICTENVFKLLTNPNAFMALKWQDRREALLQIADKRSDESLAIGNRDFEKLFGKITNNKTLEEYSKEIQASIAKAKKDLKDIPTRIDEVVRGKAEPLDWNQITLLLETKTEELEGIDTAIQNKSGMYDTEIAKNNEVKGKINLLKNWLEMNESMTRKKAKDQVADQNKNLIAVQAKIDGNLSDIATAENGLVTLKSKVKLLGDEIAETNAKIEAKRAEWYAENAKTLTFDNECFDCPTCKRAFEAKDIEAKKATLQMDFITSKKIELDKITKTAMDLKTIVTNQQKEIDALNTRIDNGNKHITSLKEANVDLEKQLKELQDNTVVLVENEIYKTLIDTDATRKAKQAEIAQLEATLVEIPVIDYSEYSEKKRVLTAEIAELNRKLHTREAIKLADDRVKKLQAEEQILSQQILDVERTQFIIDNFNRVKMEALENSINSKLQFVKFKMFEKQINGGEVPCCEAFLNGVPYSNVNTAGRINMGLDIINMLCNYYQVQAPIIIDNRESVTDIIQCESQIINLVVSPSDETLRVVQKVA